MKKLTLGLLMSSLLLCGCNIARVEAGEPSFTYDEVVFGKPGVISKGSTFTEVTRCSWDKGSTGYTFMNDDQTLTFEYGHKNHGLYFAPAGGDGGLTPRFLTATHLSKGIDTADGQMTYFDLSTVESTDGKSVGIGIGYILMDSAVEPTSGPSLWDESEKPARFIHFFPINGRTAYYYDLEKGQFVTTTIVNRTVTLPVGFKGYVYTPFSSYGWRGYSNVEYGIKPYGFNKGYKWVNYSHILTDRIKTESSQGEIFVKDTVFVKKSGTCAHSFARIGAVKASCDHLSGDLYECSSCHSYKIKDALPTRGHVYSYEKLDNSVAYGICDECNHVEEFHDQSIIDSATKVSALNSVVYTFKTGFHNENDIKVRVKKGTKINENDIPRCGRVDDDAGFYCTFIVWSSSQEFYRPLNPLTVTATGDKVFYAKYRVDEYDDVKCTQCSNLMCKSGGLYNSTKGKIVLNGNSNFCLARNTESDWSSRGMPTINNSVAGSSTYDYINYADQLVAAYQPKILCFNLTTNDQAYWSMSEKDIMDSTIKFIDYVRKQVPDIVIAVVNASPLPGRSEMFSTVNRLNATMSKYCQTKDYLEYIDTYEFVYSRMMEYPNGWEFWTHMDTETLGVWMGLIGDRIAEIIAERGIVF